MPWQTTTPIAPAPEARKAGRIPGEHGLEAVPADTRNPFVFLLLAFAALLILAGWFALNGDKKRSEVPKEAPTTSINAANEMICGRTLSSAVRHHQ